MAKKETYKYSKLNQRRKKLYRNALSKHYKVLTAEEKRIIRLQLTIKQDGCCAICDIPEKELKRQLSIDHCHITGQIRGLLCGRCNTLLGFAKDNPYILQAAIKYLLAERKYK